MTGLRGEIYVIVNRVNGRTYVGATLHGAHRRWTNHESTLRYGHHRILELQADWQTHGYEAFEMVVIEANVDPLQLRENEQRWIDQYRNEGRLLYNRSHTSGLPRQDIVRRDLDADEARRESERRARLSRRTHLERPCFECGIQLKITDRTNTNRQYCGWRCQQRAVIRRKKSAKTA